MRRFFQTTTLFGALLLGQQAFAQYNVQGPAILATPATPAKDSKQDLSQNSRQRNPFRIERFSIENFVQNVSYQDLKKHEFNYSLRIKPDSGDELKGIVRETPLLRTLYEISADKEPFQLNSRIILTISSRPNFSQGNASQGNQFYVTRGKKTSPIYGFLRKFGKIRNILKR